MAPGEIMNILVMLIVGGIAGTLAARIMRGTNFGLVVNVLLGVAGAIVGGFLFKMIGMTPGKNIVKVIDDTFDVSLPQDIIGMIVSATIGSIIIIFLFGLLKGRRNRA